MAKNTGFFNMDDVAELAGVRAKETDVVTVEFTKGEVEELLELLSWEWVEAYTNLEDKLKKANPGWEF